MKRGKRLHRLLERNTIIFFIVFFIVFWVVFISVFFIYNSFTSFSYRLATLTSSLTDTQKQLTETNQTITDIVQGNSDLQAKLSDEARKRLQIQQSEQEARASFEEKIISLQTDVKNQQEQASATDIGTIISSWSPRVAQLTCVFKTSSGDIVTDKGSAVATFLGNIPHFITNSHVLRENDATLTDCVVELLSGEDVDAAPSEVTVSSQIDIGYVRARGAAFTGILSPVKACIKKPSIGDTVVILGYPSVGGSGITATEGIISGFDNEYYTTSAKIEQGNSGGAAIDVKNNCFLGMPTLVIKGKIEALARILPI